MSSPSRDQPVIACEAAASLVARALEHAEGNGWAVSAVAVDPWGLIVASGRMDGVPAPVHEFAADTAYTAILRRPYIERTIVTEKFAFLPYFQGVRENPCKIAPGIFMQFRLNLKF